MYVENNAMHVNPKQKMMHEKKIFGQILKNLIKSGRFKQKFLIAISIGRVTGSIDQKFGKIIFFFFFFFGKTGNFSIESIFKRFFMTCNT